LDGENYRKYTAIYRRVADEAEISYYKEKFDNYINSAKQLWRNLNTVCCMNSRKKKSCDISKLNVNNNAFTKPLDISNELNSYFTTVGEKLNNKLASIHSLNMTDFKTYCDKLPKHSIGVWPADISELMSLIKNFKKIIKQQNQTK